MFIRKTRIPKLETGKSYFNFQLVESYRTERGPRQRILLNLGPDLDLEKPELKSLANRIEEILKGVVSLFAVDDKIESLAQKYASQLLHRLSGQTKESQPQDDASYRMIDSQTIEQQEPRTVGAEHLLLHLASELKMRKKFKELGFSEKEIALSLATIIGRAVFPASERATHEWLTQRSGLGELLNYDFRATTLGHLYKIGDLLLAHKEELEKYLDQAQQQVHGYRSTLVIYDLTNTYMEGRAKGNKKATFGRSKEKRTDCPLVTLGLVINEHGFASRSSFLPGNISEPKTLREAIEKLSDSKDLFKPVVVLDAGIATVENLQWLREHQYRYIVSARQNAPSRELEGALESAGNDTGVKVALIKSNDEEERWLYCESEAKRAVSSQMKKLFRARFEGALEQMRLSLSKPRGRKRYSKVLERIGRLKEKHSRVSGCYEIIVEPSGDGERAVCITWKVRPEKLEERLNGHYFLRTNLTHLAAPQLWKLYDNLRTVEDAFRFMKSSLGMRPVHHQKEERVDGHLWITILAYHLIQSCLYRFNQQGIHYHWQTIRDRLSSRMRVTMQAKTNEGKMLYHRSSTKAEDRQMEIYRTLGLSPQIMKAKEVVV